MEDEQLTFHETMWRAAEKYFLDMVARYPSPSGNGPNITKIAGAAGLNRTHVYKMLRQLGLSVERSGPMRTEPATTDLMRAFLGSKRTVSYYGRGKP